MLILHLVAVSECPALFKQLREAWVESKKGNRIISLLKRGGYVLTRSI